RILEKGCPQITLAMGEGPADGNTQGDSIVIEALSSVAGSQGQVLRAGWLNWPVSGNKTVENRCARRPTPHPPISGMRAGFEIAQHLLALPPADRPDGLIIEDDYLAMGLTSALARYCDYRPMLAVCTTRQSPLAFALPVIRYETDIQ